MNDVLKLLTSHSSVRDFLAKSVDDDLLKELIQAGQSAATSNHVQAYTIIRIRDKDKRKQLAALAGDQQYVADCPVFLVFCADLNRLTTACQMNNETADNSSTETFIVATVDTALVAQNIMIAAESNGLGGVYIGAIRNHPREVCDLLQIPQHVYPVFGMCLGYPEQVNATKPRLPLPLVLHEDCYGADQEQVHLQKYDGIMSDYYSKRTNGTRHTTWTEGVAVMLKQKQRPHMKNFIAGQGFDLD